MNLKHAKNMVDHWILKIKIIEKERESITRLRYGYSRRNRTNIDVDITFLHINVALDIILENKNLEPRSIEECRERKYWSLWKEAFKVELNSFQNVNFWTYSLNTRRCQTCEI